MQAPNTSISSNFADRLRWFRIQRNLGQSDLGKVVDRRASSISDWEKGRTQPRLDEISRLAKALGVSAGRLAFGEDEEPRVEERDPNDPESEIRAHFEILLAAADRNPGRLGWLLEQMLQHLGPPKHWSSDRLSDRERQVDREINERNRATREAYRAEKRGGGDKTQSA